MARLSKAEITKDTVQNAVGATASTVGEVAGIITGAVRDVANAVGNLGTELFEMGDAAKQAAEDDDPATT
ncbi:hypothetical protein [Nocardioides acrostichi]|uniref:Uncharacterized protein n=1 Tax=Nocardioides acrostichi TaxID=2784339 RepID=A0A930Y6F9_9ACTN|nr:hypothetical protein [Nocardioides acrostichi]MBF4160896.1 hypothetical protein [Nocardioides acrostichi]